MTVLITLTLAGSDTGPFNLYSDVNGFTTPFQTGVSKSVLEAGLSSSSVPDGSSTILVKSTGACNRDLYLTIAGNTTTTTTSTTSSSSTTSTSTTAAPTSKITNFGARNVAGAIRKNGVNVTSFAVGNGGAYTTVSLSGVTWGPTDKLEMIINSTAPFGASLTITDATISPNGAVLQSPTSYTGNGGNIVALEFNGSGSGWGVNPMTWFNITFKAN